MAPPALAAGVVADWLASGINQNLTAFRSSPGAALLELQVTGWIREMVGLPRGASGLRSQPHDDHLPRRRPGVVIPAEAGIHVPYPP